MAHVSESLRKATISATFRSQVDLTDYCPYAAVHRVGCKAGVPCSDRQRTRVPDADGGRFARDHAPNGPKSARRIRSRSPRRLRVATLVEPRLHQHGKECVTDVSGRMSPVCQAAHSFPVVSLIFKNHPRFVPKARSSELTHGAPPFGTRLAIKLY